MRLELARHPSRLKARNALIIDELLALAANGRRRGARVYLVLLEGDSAGIVNCEIKEGDAPNIETLRVVLTVVAAYQRGVPVFEEPGL